MQEITMDECRQLQLDLLRHFDAFCLILSLFGMVTTYIQFQHYKKMVNEWKSYSEEIEHRIMLKLDIGCNHSK